MRGTSTIGISYKRDKKIIDYVKGFVDADYAGDKDTKKLMTGFVFMVWDNVVS